MLDVCTGSGAVALALAHERPDLRITGSDISAEALALAGENARRLGLPVSWLHADLLDHMEMPPAAVLANPPYVPDAEHSGLAPEITRHEPSLALLGGPDGLDVVRRLIAQAGAARVPLLAVEVGAGQAAEAIELARAAGFARVRAERDLAGIERAVVAEC